MNDFVKNIIEWYLDAGVDETISDIPFGTEKETSITTTNNNSRQATTPLSQSTIAAKQSSKSIAEKAKSLEELRKIIENFEGCSLKLTATNTVFGYGNSNAKIMFIGEAPGADEDRTGEPFVGKSGQLLDKMLSAIGISREQCFISNVLPWRPPGNRTPTDSEISVCLPFLKRQIELVSPEFIFILGGSASNSILEKSEPISKLRGKWFEYRKDDGTTIKTLTSFHPAYLLRNNGQKDKAWADFIKLKKNIC